MKIGENNKSLEQKGPSMITLRGGVDETLRNYQGGVQPILTVPYRGGREVQKSKKLPYVMHEQPLKRFNDFSNFFRSQFSYPTSSGYLE